MVLAFFKGSSNESGFDHIVSKSISMLGDARHSFDLATIALLTATDADAVARDIRATDQRINDAEQELRSELVVHVSVHGSANVGAALGFALLVKKIERIGDQAKNILDLAEHGVSLADHPETAMLLTERATVSELFADTATLLGDTDLDEDHLEEFAQRATEMADELQVKIDGWMHSDRPGFEVVPLAIYHRYLRRIIANLVGVVRTSAEPLHHHDDGPDLND